MSGDGMPHVNREPMHREVTIDQRFPRWWDKWVNPTTILAVLGGIVWGIQLNIAVLNHTSQVAKLQEFDQTNVRLMHEQSLQLTRVSVMLDDITRRIQELEGHH